MKAQISTGTMDGNLMDARAVGVRLSWMALGVAAALALVSTLRAAPVAELSSHVMHGAPTARVAPRIVAPPVLPGASSMDGDLTPVAVR